MAKSLVRINDGHATDMFGSGALFSFFIIVLSISVITMIIFSCGVDSSSESRRRRNRGGRGGLGGGAVEGGGGCRGGGDGGGCGGGS